MMSSDIKGILCGANRYCVIQNKLYRVILTGSRQGQKMQDEWCEWTGLGFIKADIAAEPHHFIEICVGPNTSLVPASI